MKKTILPLALLLILTLLNLEYGNFKDLNFGKSEYLEVLMILICVTGILFNLRTSKSKTQSNGS